MINVGFELASDSSHISLVLLVQAFYGEYFEALEDLEPISPTAIIHINKINMPEIDTKTIISEENLAKNVDEHRSGELLD